MNGKQKKVLIIFLLAAAAVGIIIVKKETASRQSSEAITNPSTDVVARNKDAVKLPRLVDLGAGKCIPCKLMAPILEELKKEYAGRFEVNFLDVWKNPKIARQYNIRIIPTQIFYDSNGEELFRHEGFFSKEGILAKWKELGVEFAKSK